MTRRVEAPLDSRRTDTLAQGREASTSIESRSQSAALQLE